MKTIWAAAAASLALALAGAAQAADPTAKLDSGVVVGAEQNGVEVYKGIPYAKPPVGALRWTPPQRATPWKGERKALDFGAPCMQPQRPQAPAGPGAPSEDCLYVNVWAPANAKGAPVMVWIHGGSNISGSGANYDGSKFARDGIVLVTINYRMGAFGFFSHPAISKAAKADEPLSNYAFMDQMAALQWVQRNAAAFGGNPQNVTVFGESAGAMDIVALLGIPQTKGLYAKAIVESNIGWGTAAPLGQKEEQGVQIATKAGAPENATLDQLRAIPADKLLAAQTGASTAIDGRLVREAAYTAFQNGRAVDVPLIIGSNSYEASLIAARNPTPQQAADYTDGSAGAPARFIAAHEANGAPVWLYHFSYVRDQDRPTAAGAIHASEIPFVFDTLSRPTAYVKEPRPTENDQAMATKMHACWVSFAKVGKPYCAWGSEWPAYQPSTDQTMIFGDDSKVVAHFRKEQLDLAEQQQATRMAAGGGRGPAARASNAPSR
ncbi:MAG TPA: carboxylesterase family protein [Caulobacteraceae bacterium]|nr:carboxylesterase family protein [Caulobacteraceae bacterium]